MTRLTELLDIAALFHGWGEHERNLLAAELAELDEWRKLMPQISQDALDKLTADVAANTQAITDTKTRVGALQDQLVTAQSEVGSLKVQIDNLGADVDTSALEAALEAATATAQGIAQAPAVPAPVVPVVNPADPAGPVQAPDAPSADPAAAQSDGTNA